MRIKTDIMRFALAQARELNFSYGAGSVHSGRKNVDGALEVVRNTLGKNIELVSNHPDENPQKVELMRAWYVALDDEHKSYRIYVRRPQNPIWARFATFKELLHVVLDSKMSVPWRVVEVYPHIMDVVQNLLESDEPGEKTASEKVAEIAAMEFCLPYQERLKRFNEARAIGRTPDYRAIALEYGLPEPIVRRYLGSAQMATLLEYEL